MRCANCGSENEGEFKFCVRCGAALGQAERIGSPNADLTKTCQYCGRALNAKATFCDICGRSTLAVQPYQMPYPVPPVPKVTAGRKVIAVGLIVTGLYFIWWGMYSVYYGASYDWEYWGTADYMDLIFSFVAGLFVLVAGLISLVKR